MLFGKEFLGIGVYFEMVECGKGGIFDAKDV